MTVDEAMRLALEHQRARRIREADVLYTEILKAAPDHVPAIQQLGCLAFEVGQFDLAADFLRRAATLDPFVAAHWNNLGEALRMAGDPDGSVAAFAEAMRLDPDDWIPCKNLGLGLVLAGRLKHASDAFARINRGHPLNAEGWHLQGYAQLEMGNQREAVALLRKAVAMAPGLAEAQSHLRIALNHVEDDAMGARTLFSPPFPSASETVGLADGSVRAPVPDRPLRVGFVSADFRQHSCAYFLEPVFAHHDRARFSFHAYAIGNRRDQVTDRIAAQLAGMRNLTPMTDDQAAAQIEADGIDILVDLAGHTPGHRLGIFARRPAPVQVAWLGYPATTGLPQIGFRLTDALADPPGETEHLHSEELVRLPRSFLCYGAALSGDKPEVAPLPAPKAGRFTFGSFNRLAKVTPEMIALWAQILRRAPGSRLYLKSFGLKDPATCALVAGRFAARGIGAERLRLEGFRDCLHDHLLAYHEVDLALDTFPYHGTTTSCEALRMGVPVVTLAGRTHVSRVGVSLMTHLSLPEFVTHTPEAYADIAVAWAGRQGELAKLRQGLRARFMLSPLGDAEGFARDFEAALLELARRA